MTHGAHTQATELDFMSSAAQTKVLHYPSIIILSLPPVCSIRFDTARSPPLCDDMMFFSFRSPP